MKQLPFFLGLALLMCYACADNTPAKVDSHDTPDPAVKALTAAPEIKLLRLYFPVAALGSDKAVVAIPILRKDSLVGGIYGFAFSGGSSARKLSFSLITTCKADSTIKTSLPDTVLFSSLLISKPLVKEIRKAANGYQTVLLQPEIVSGTIVWTIYATQSGFPLTENELLTVKTKIGIANPCPPGNMED